MKRLALFMMCSMLLMTGVSASEHPGYLERAELRFLQGMSDHHQMALDMAADCLNAASDARVIAICEAVVVAQTPEIAQMRVWLLDWYEVDYRMVSMLGEMEQDGGGHSGHGGHGGHGGAAQAPFTDPVMMMGMFAGLNRLDGVEYDIAWLEAMIDHHDDAIHMAERLVRRGAAHPEVAALAQAIIDAQSVEIGQMEALIGELAG